MPDDIYKTRETYEKEKLMIAESDTISENKKLIADFLRRMEIEDISYVQLVKYTASLRQFLSIYKRSLLLAETADMEDYLIFMKDYAHGTRHIRFFAMKKFFGFLNKPDVCEKIKFRSVGFMDVLPDSILTKEEVKLVIDSAGKYRAFVAVLYESGARLGEILTLRRENVCFDDNGAVLKVGGKTGQRTIRIIDYAPLLREFMSFGYCALVFPYQPHAVAMQLMRIENKLNLGKHLHPHLFRHTRATHLAPYLTEPEMRIMFGWSRRSKMPALYVHLSGRDVQNKLIRMHKEMAVEATNSQERGNDIGNFSDPAFQTFLMQQFRQWKAINGSRTSSNSRTEIPLRISRNTSLRA